MFSETTRYFNRLRNPLTTFPVSSALCGVGLSVPERILGVANQAPRCSFRCPVAAIAKRFSLEVAELEPAARARVFPGCSAADGSPSSTGAVPSASAVLRVSARERTSMECSRGPPSDWDHPRITCAPSGGPAPSGIVACLICMRSLPVRLLSRQGSEIVDTLKYLP